VLDAQLSATLRDVAPVPDNETACGEFVALLAMLMPPVADPDVVGLKETVMVALWLGARIKPAFTPELLKPAPVTPTLEIVMLEFPVFCRETFCELLDPTVTLPNDTLEGETLSE